MARARTPGRVSPMGRPSPVADGLEPRRRMPEEIENDCLSYRRARIQFWIDDTPAGAILDGREGEPGASGAYHGIFGERVDHSAISGSSADPGQLPQWCSGDRRAEPP
ncbi:uncharacterized protein SOCEGT47_078360 [Sorangium cellulosum]|uniref:Uncharacterized protein n=1 Tax=Sorangium cellulosum TaxID=56 RepID=A0A4V0NET1_SORCE|nr:uncharacterized protein SOCEGT47_078360 [Sorangium cellulosum]